MKIQLLAAGAAVVVTLASTAAAAPSQDVTLRLERFRDPTSGVAMLRLSGTIASPAANELVEVMQQQCGNTFSTVFASVRTQAGGSWEVEKPGAGASATYRARWNDRLSEPATVRPAIPLVFSKLRAGRYRVTITLYAAPPQKLSGRTVQLQRRAAGLWTGVRRARLRADPKSYGRAFSATFAVPTRGLTLRILVPARTAAPCYTANATKPWVS